MQVSLNPNDRRYVSMKKIPRVVKGFSRAPKTRFYCKTHKSLQRVIAVSADEKILQLECGCSRTVQTEMGA